LNAHAAGPASGKNYGADHDVFAILSDS
jgi:hypothetical protein